jgi:hypothetical protein
VIDSGEQTDGAIRIHQNGDIQFGLGTIYMDPANNVLGIGTTTPETVPELHIVDGVPQIQLTEAGVGQVAFQYFNNIFGILTDIDNDNNFGQAMGITGEHVTPFSYVVAERGDGEFDSMFGIGPNTPEAATLHVRGVDAASGKNNTTQLLLQNQSETVANRVMIRIANAGNPQMLWENTETGHTWQVNPIGASFVISLGGTGGQEARFTSAGNLVLRGDVLTNSDRNTKDNIAPVDPKVVLDSVLDLEVSRWHRKQEADDVEHIGPMAQDFYAAFGLGNDDKKISTLDTAGVALAAIQGLHGELAARDERIDTLKAELAEQSRRMAAMEKRLAALPVAD